MLKIANYEIVKEVYQSLNTLIYMATREEDKKRVILKVLKKEYPTTLALESYENEFNILNSLDSKYIIKAYELKKYENRYFLVMEDLNAKTLF